MQLRTPKRYSSRRPKRRLISLRWLWLYLLAPIVIYGSLLVYHNQDYVGGQVSNYVSHFQLPNFNPPTPTATIPAQSLDEQITSYLKSGDVNQALTVMGEYTDSNPNDTQWHIARPEFLALRADSDPVLIREAVDAGMAAINAAPELSTTWAAEALALDWSNRNNDPTIEKQALIDILHAQDLNSSDPVTLAVLGGIDVTLGKYPDATANADKALKLDPNTSYAYFVKGQVAALTGDVKTATNYYKQAWDISLSDPLQWGGKYVLSLVEILMQEGQASQAQTILGDALKYDKTYARLGRQMSDLFYNQGDPNKAIQAAQQCTDTAPKYAPCWAVLPKLLSLDKAYDKAARAADTAQALGSTEMSPYYWGGEAYYQLNECDHAIPLWQQGLQIVRKSTDQSHTSDFTDALNQCGITASQYATPTPGAPNVNTVTAAPTTAATKSATRSAP